VTTQEITIIKNATRETAIIEYERSTCSLSITFANGQKKAYADLDIYVCFGLMRKEFNHITFLCKGAKINVYPSSMSSQMSSGVVAYEVKMGESEAVPVRIFDPEENDLTNDIRMQVEFRKKWANSI
jgi:hypothetical protein